MKLFSILAVLACSLASATAKPTIAANVEGVKDDQPSISALEKENAEKKLEEVQAKNRLETWKDFEYGPVAPGEKPNKCQLNIVWTRHWNEFIYARYRVVATAEPLNETVTQLDMLEQWKAKFYESAIKRKLHNPGQNAQCHTWTKDVNKPIRDALKDQSNKEAREGNAYAALHYQQKADEVPEKTKWYAFCDMSAHHGGLGHKKYTIIHKRTAREWRKWAGDKCEVYVDV